MSKSYLVPTVITDVTGKTTTVYRRVDSVAPTAAALPAPQVHGAPTIPAISAKAPTPPERPLLHRLIPALGRQHEAKQRAHLVYDISKVAPDSDRFYNCDTPTLNKVKRIFDSLPSTDQRKNIIDTVSFAAEVIPRDLNGDVSQRIIDTIHDNLDVLPHIDYDVKFLSTLHRSLGQIGSDHRIKNMDTHIKAWKAFSEDPSHVVRPYEENVAYVRAVHANPNKVNTLIKYAQIVKSNPETGRSLRYDDVLNDLVDVLSQFPGREEQILMYMRERGDSVPTVEDMTDMFDHHGAINEGWL